MLSPKTAQARLVTTMTPSTDGNLPAALESTTSIKIGSQSGVGEGDEFEREGLIYLDSTLICFSVFFCSLGGLYQKVFWGLLFTFL